MPLVTAKGFQMAIIYSKIIVFAVQSKFYQYPSLGSIFVEIKNTSGRAKSRKSPTLQYSRFSDEIEGKFREHERFARC